ncbi:MAG: hypothetical protein AVDCRST_MAG89-4133, partial [uncultured Gemmatimonadetes bacterium]
GRARRGRQPVRGRGERADAAGEVPHRGGHPRGHHRHPGHRHGPARRIAAVHRRGHRPARQRHPRRAHHLVLEHRQRGQGGRERPGHGEPGGLHLHHGDQRIAHRQRRADRGRTDPPLDPDGHRPRPGELGGVGHFGEQRVRGQLDQHPALRRHPVEQHRHGAVARHPGHLGHRRGQHLRRGPDRAHPSLERKRLVLRAFRRQHRVRPGAGGLEQPPGEHLPVGRVGGRAGRLVHRGRPGHRAARQARRLDEDEHPREHAAAPGVGLVGQRRVRHRRRGRAPSLRRDVVVAGDAARRHGRLLRRVGFVVQRRVRGGRSGQGVPLRRLDVDRHAAPDAEPAVWRVGHLAQQRVRRRAGGRDLPVERLAVDHGGGPGPAGVRLLGPHGHRRLRGPERLADPAPV